MANQILISVDKKRLSVAPGASANLAVTAQNLTTLLDQVAVRAEGIDPSWAQVIPPYLPVFAQGQATARVVFQPPRDPAVAVAGLYRLRLHGSSQEYPGQEGDAATELEIQLVGDYRFWLDKAETHDHQEVVFPVQVQNSANAPLQLQFKGSDAANELWFKFDPFQLTVPAGGQATARLTLRAKGTAPEARALPFSLIAQGEYTPKDGAPVAAPTHQVAGQFVQGAPARLTLAIQPAQAQATDVATYQVRVGNPGAAPATVQLSGAGDDGSLSLDFEHVQATLPPQSETTIRLVVRANMPPTSGVSARREFSVTARPTNGETLAVSTEATFVQLVPTPVAPAQKSLAWVIALAALLSAFLIVLLLLAAYEIGFLR
jgi:hypothetical protein